MTHLRSEDPGRSARGSKGWAAVLFDLDGTLADTVPLILACYRHTMRTHLGRELPDEEWLRTIGTPVRAQLWAFARTDDEHAAMLETYVTFQRAQRDEGLKAYPGARRVVRRLAGSGAGLAVVTSKGREMALRTLERCGLADLFSVLVSADDVALAKPDPEPVMRALDALDLTGRGEDVLFVGDSPYDVTAGRRAGVRTAAALWGPFERAELELAEPHHFVTRLDDLLALSPAGREGADGAGPGADE